MGSCCRPGTWICWSHGLPACLCIDQGRVSNQPHHAGTDIEVLNIVFPFWAAGFVGAVLCPSLNQQCADSGYWSICTADQMSVLFFFWLVFKSCSFHSEHHDCLCTFQTHEAPPVRHLFPHLSEWWLLRLLPPLRLSHKWCPVLLEPSPLTGEGTSSWCTSGTLTSWRTSTSKPAVRNAWNPPQVPQATSCNLINIYQLYLLIDHKS